MQEANQAGLRGYYVWPRLGFIIYLAGYGAELEAAGFDRVDNTLDLFDLDGGANWWYDHGSEADATFLLQADSRCVMALKSYLAANSIEVSDDDRNG